MDAGDAVSAEALRIEREAISEFVYDWMYKRLGRNFPGIRIGVWHDGVDRHIVRVAYEHNNVIHQAEEPLLDHTINRKSGTTQQWSQYMDQIVGYVRKKVTSSLLREGIHELPGAVPVDAKGWYEAGTPRGVFRTSSFAAAANDAASAMKNLGDKVRLVGVSMAAFDEKLLEAEERAAIESIKRSAAGE